MTNSALAATFADFRLVRGRKVAQLILEIPIEQAEAAINLFGMPMPERERWVGVAPMVGNPHDRPASPPAEQAAPEPARKPQTSRDLSDMERARTRCAILCGDKQFQWWIGAVDADEATEKVRRRIGGSRSTIATDKAAFEAFIALETDYRAATGQIAERR